MLLLRQRMEKRVEQSEEKGRKFDESKSPLSWIPASAVREIGNVLKFGAKKYGKNNYKKGMEWSRLADAALRHIYAWADGEDLDQESKLPHLAHAGCCIVMLLFYQAKGVGEDDR